MGPTPIHQAAQQRGWVGYVDRTTNEPAFAVCMPLSNLTYTGRLSDENGVVGVSCAGVYISAISEKLLPLVDSEQGALSFIRERSTARLVAASSNRSADYYNAATFTRHLSVDSPNKVIAWISRRLGNYTGTGEWPTDVTTVFNDTTGEVGNAAFFVTVIVFRDTSTLEWDVVSVQRVDCSVNYEVGLTKKTCVPCIFPHTSLGGNFPCNRCERGFYQLEYGGDCFECPDGATCSGGHELPTNKVGYWGDPMGWKDKSRAEFYQCETLAGMSCRANYKCLKGFAGRHCSIPDQGFMFVGSLCSECGRIGSSSSKGYNGLQVGEGLQIAIVFSFLILFVFTMEYLSFYYETISILLNSLQTVALIYEFEFSWPQNSFRTLDTVFQWILFGFDSVIPTCTTRSWTWKSSFVLQLLLPAAIIPIALLVNALTRRWVSWDKCVGACIIFVDIAYVGVVLTCFQGVACQSEIDGNSYLFAAPNIQCWDDGHWPIAVLAIISLVAFGLGYPLAVGVIVYTKLRRSTEPLSDEVFHKYGFIFDSFRYKHNYWGIVQLFRNMVMCAIASLGFSHPEFQGSIAMLVAVIYLTGIMHFEPYISRQYNFLDALLVIIEMGIIVFGYMWGYHAQNIGLEVSMVAVLMAYPTLGTFVVASEMVSDDIERETQARMLSLHKNVKAHRQKSRKKSVLEDQGITSFGRNGSGYLRPATDVAKGCCTSRRRKGVKGHEEEDKVVSFVDAISPWRFNEWVHHKVSGGLHYSTCRLWLISGIGDALITHLCVCLALQRAATGSTLKIVGRLR